MKQSIQFIPLTFINTADDLAHQIKNTVIFSHLQNLYPEANLGSYLENTQYGFTASALASGSHRLLRITDINNGVVDWKTVPYCECDSAGKYLLRKGDILIARTGGTTGKSFLVEKVPGNAVFASYLIRLRVKREYEVDFINAFLNSYLFWSQIVEMKSGSAQPNVNAEKLKELRLPGCDIEIQKDVVKLLRGEPTVGLKDLNESIGSAINKFKTVRTLNDELSTQSVLVEELRQSILQEAVRGKLLPQDSFDEPASELLKKIKAEKAKLISDGKLKKEKPLPPITTEEIPFELPKGWVWSRLTDVGKITGGGTPSMAHPEYWNGSIPWISPKDMWNEVVTDSEMKITEKGIASSAANIIPRGSLLIVGRSGILKRKLPVAINEVECTVNQDMKVLVPYFPSMARYLQLMLFGMEELVLTNFVKFGMTVHSLKYQEFEMMPIPIPSESEQVLIIKKVEHVSKICDQLEQNIKKSQLEGEQLLQAVLREAFNEGGESSQSSRN